MSNIKTLYDQISGIYGKVPKKVVSDLLKHIPKELESDEDAYDSYVYLNQLYTYGEYKSCLALYDKAYHSNIHDYGEMEELVYTFRSVTPGLIKDHRIRNDRGRFIHTTETLNPKVERNKSNIFLIKRTIWDNMKYDKKMVLYTIYVYVHDSAVENQRKLQAETTLANLKKSFNESAANEKG
jgi:hypothetical protein